MASVVEFRLLLEYKFLMTFADNPSVGRGFPLIWQKFAQLHYTDLNDLNDYCVLWNEFTYGYNFLQGNNIFTHGMCTNYAINFDESSQQNECYEMSLHIYGYKTRLWISF